MNNHSFDCTPAELATFPAFIRSSLQEDMGDGDHTSLACIREGAKGKARLLVKDTGVLAGQQLAELIFREINPALQITTFLKDGAAIKPGDVVFEVSGDERHILLGERLVLNCMQRMSGVATTTSRYVAQIEGTGARVIDTRKTTPGMRALEKWAVRIGGGYNHRIGLYDMILIKDNHVDYAGGIGPAIHAAKNYLNLTGKSLKIEIEVRNFNELDEALSTGGIDRILLDNFTSADLHKAVKQIAHSCETEASGGITEKTIREYALTGVDFISVGALTHSVKSLDLSLKAVDTPLI
jgi:nicotinate-nucleotide pyrophosphorylase (carboxylating)